MNDPARPSLPQRWVKGLAEIIRELSDLVGGDPQVRRQVLSDLGLNPDSDAELLIPDQTSDSIDAYTGAVDPDLEAFLSVVDDFVKVVDAVEGFVEIAGGTNEQLRDEAIHQLFTLATLQVWKYRLPWIYWWGRLLGFINEQFDVVVVPRFILGNLWEMLTDPVTYFPSLWRDVKDFYDEPAGLDDEAHARVLSDRTLMPLAAIVSLLADHYRLADDVQVLYGWEQSPGSLTPVSDLVSDRTLTISFRTTLIDEKGETVRETILITLIWVHEEHQGPGLFVSLGGNVKGVGKPFQGWKLGLTFKSDQAASFMIRGFPVEAGEGPSDAGMALSIKRAAADADLPLVFPSAKGTRLEFRDLSFSGELSTGRVGAKAVAGKSALVIASSDGDGLIREIFPAGELRLDFALGLGYEHGRGFYLEGGTGLSAIVPLARSLGPLKVQYLQLALRLGGDSEQPDVALQVTAAIAVKLGGFTATVDGIGFEFTLDFPDRLRDLSTENLGLGFKGPSSVGLVIDSNLVSGGGFLFLDPATGQYAGSLMLEFHRFTLVATGLLSTRLPDGSQGVSLLLVLSVQDFTPYPIGFGFTLNGVGGVLGYNHTLAVETVRQGLKAGILNSVLFPENPVANAPRIISNLRSIFPIQKGQTIFALTAKIGWGRPPILTSDLALGYEGPNPRRIILMGQLKARIPAQLDSDRSPIRLNLDALGVVDLDTGDIAVDATLYDSYLAGSKVSGDAAFRGRFGSDPDFLLAAGGFHPAYAPPAGFPSLERLTANLSRGDSFRFTLQLYLALGPSTGQIGVRADLFVGVAGFSIEGYLAFDAMVETSTGFFSFGLSFAVTVKWRGRTLLGVHFEGLITGSTPLCLSGKVSVKILFWSKSFSVDRSLGDEEAVPALPAADPLPELVAALGDPRSWSAELPNGGHQLVTLRPPAEAGNLLVHPLGELAVRQRVVPLNVTISRFGGVLPSGDRRFSVVADLSGAGGLDATQPISDYFAPGHFVNLTDAEKLSRPSFELMDAGLRIGSTGVTFGGQADSQHSVVTTLEHETCILDSGGDCVRQVEPLDLAQGVLDAVLAFGAAARSDIRRSGRGKYRAPAIGVSVREPAYVVANTEDLAIATLEAEGSLLPSQRLSYVAARQALDAHLRQHPEDRLRLQVVPAYEAQGSPA